MNHAFPGANIGGRKGQGGVSVGSLPQKRPPAAREWHRAPARHPQFRMMLSRLRTRRARGVLVVTLVVLLAGVVLNLVLNATPVLPVALLLAAAAVIGLVLFLTRGQS